MKKLFTLVFGIMLAMVANAETTENLQLGGNAWNVNFPMKENVKLTCKGVYAEYKLTGDAFKAADFKGYRVEYSDITGTPDENKIIFQMKLTSKETKEGKDWQGKPAQVPIVEKYYPLDASKTSFEGNFSDFTDEAPTVGGFLLQSINASSTIILKKVVLIKNDDSEVQTTFAGDTWGGSGYKVESQAVGFPPMEFLGQYGGQQLLKADKTACSWSQATVGDGAVQVYTITLKEPSGCPVNIELQGADGAFKWLNYAAGVKTIEFTLDKTVCVAGDDKVVTDVKEIWIKASEKGTDANPIYPASFNIESMTCVSKTAETTNISNTVVAPTAKSAKIYNLAGQQVSKAYKGVVVKNGKKYVQK